LSIEGLIKPIIRIQNETEGLDSKNQIKKAQEIIKETDQKGLVATPANSSFNELVMEAGRLSILNGGKPVMIEYGENPKVRFKEDRDYKKY